MVGESPWRRFEQAGVPGNFFEVRLVPAGFAVRFGPRGRHAREQVRARKSAEEAQAEVEKLIQAHLDRGYEEVFEAAVAAAKLAERARLGRVAENPVLEAACRAAPDDPNVHAVYVDWLIEQADPRGEIAAQLRAGKMNEAFALVALHARLLCGVDRLPDVFEVHARHGFVDALTVTVETVSIFDAPLAQFARRLTIADSQTLGPAALERALVQLAGLRRAPELRELELIRPPLLNVQDVLPLAALPHFERIRVGRWGGPVVVTREDVLAYADRPATAIEGIAADRAYAALPRPTREPVSEMELAERCDRVRTAVANLGAWFADHVPAVAENLRPGADPATLDGAPDELRTLWSIHDGQHAERHSIFGHWDLLRSDSQGDWGESTLQSLRTVEVATRGDFDVDELDGEWIVFADFNFSDMLAVSIVTGRVAELWAKELESCRVVADSLADYLEELSPTVDDYRSDDG